jgi:hypothetical protein
MKTPEELRAKAAKSRRLAAAMSDASTAGQLRQFALQLEALADTLAGLSEESIFGSEDGVFRGDQSGDIVRPSSNGTRTDRAGGSGR